MGQGVEIVCLSDNGDLLPGMLVVSPLVACGLFVFLAFAVLIWHLLSALVGNFCCVDSPAPVNRDDG